MLVKTWAAFELDEEEFTYEHEAWPEDVDPISAAVPVCPEIELEDMPYLIQALNTYEEIIGSILTSEIERLKRCQSTKYS